MLILPGFSLHPGADSWSFGWQNTEGANWDFKFPFTMCKWDLNANDITWSAIFSQPDIFLVIKNTLFSHLIYMA